MFLFLQSFKYIVSYCYTNYSFYSFADTINWLQGIAILNSLILVICLDTVK